MNNEEKAKELTARMSMLLGTFIMIVTAKQEIVSRGIKLNNRFVFMMSY